MSSELLAQALAAAGAEIGDKATALIVAQLRLQVVEGQLAQALEHGALQAARITEDAQTILAVRADRDEWRAKAEKIVALTRTKNRGKQP